jgi:putative nucleotidyltransferase with HDIG domain
MDEHGMLPNIKAHSMTVCSFALSLARAANRCGCSFDLAAIEAAALLHDITKTRSLSTDEDHARTGAELLRQLGFSPIAPLVEGHVHPRQAAGGALTAEELLSYADKRVLHDRVVPLEERFGYLYERYGRSEQAIERIGRARLRAAEIEHKLRRLLAQDAAGPAPDLL